ncbi:phage integrase [Nitrobacter hamburgensis X14]|uniref:Phage integrase n=1 Tax=Nitrobacter hamburgensis (strain DSM 10229 / NCIMB 13809 / X14) TaxID=323097 RepID=Q1QLE5_NITHX|nr:site-specific integrase [Nitrobacter hamburgensis]ABE62952.1 phage integrase [Nitrobacter hamburgensis X14]
MLRLYAGEQTYQTETLATADDFSDADGVAILDWKQAQTLARRRMVDYAHSEAGLAKPLTVADAMADYLVYLESKTKSGREGRYAAEAFILPAFGKVEVAKLTKEQIDRWHAEMAKAPARIRTKNGRRQRFKTTTDPENDRRRKSTANRILTTFKAALNMAWRDGKVPTDAAWRRVTPFESVDQARIRYLSMDEAKRLLEACSPSFKRLVRVALETGARYGELIALRVEDFNADAGTLHIRDSKSGKPRHVVLTPEAVTFVVKVAKGRSPSSMLLVKENGEPWQRDHQADPLKNACATAKIDPPINFHALRHTWASHAVMRGVALQIVARQLGHTTTRVTEQHYAHLAPSFVADAIRANAPRFS